MKIRHIYFGKDLLPNYPPPLPPLLKNTPCTENKSNNCIIPLSEF